MTITMRLQQQRDRTLLWGVMVSILLHAALFLPTLQNVFKSLDLKLEEEPKLPPLEFTLVSPPENPTPNEEQSRYLSNVSSAARDRMESRDQDDVPHGEGPSPFPDTPSPTPGKEGGGANPTPPLPSETTDLSDAFERSKYSDEQRPRNEPSLPEENPEFRNEGSARASIGGISLSTTAWDFAPYLLDLKHRIKQHWIPPLAFTALGAIHGYTWVRFRIYPDGRMEACEIVETEGHDSLHRSSANAVKGAAPFRKLPADFPDEYLEITFGFYYLLPGDEERFFKRNERSDP